MSMSAVPYHQFLGLDRYDSYLSIKRDCAGPSGTLNPPVPAVSTLQGRDWGCRILIPSCAAHNQAVNSGPLGMISLGAAAVNGRPNIRLNSASAAPCQVHGHQSCHPRSLGGNHPPRGRGLWQIHPGGCSRTAGYAIRAAGSPL